MASFNKIDTFVFEVLRARHDFENAEIKVALSNTAPGSISPNPEKVEDIVEIDYANLSSRVFTGVALVRSGGTARVMANDRLGYLAQHANRARWIGGKSLESRHNWWFRLCCFAGTPLQPVVDHPACGHHIFTGSEPYRARLHRQI